MIIKTNSLFCNGRELATDNIGPGVWLLYNYRVAKGVPKFINDKEMRRKELTKLMKNRNGHLV